MYMTPLNSLCAPSHLHHVLAEIRAGIIIAVPFSPSMLQYEGEYLQADMFDFISNYLFQEVGVPSVFPYFFLL